MKSPEGEMPKQSIEEVLRTHTPALMAIPGVVGTYMGAADDGTLIIKVMVREDTEELRKLLPKQLGGYAVVIEETGEIRPLDGGD